MVFKKLLLITLLITSITGYTQIEYNRTIESFDNVSFLVKIALKKGDIAGAAKIQEEINPGYAIEVLKGAKSLNSYESNTIKFVWEEIPSDSIVYIEYLASPESSKTKKLEVSGYFLYLINDVAQKYISTPTFATVNGEEIAMYEPKKPILPSEETGIEDPDLQPKKEAKKEVLAIKDFSETENETLTEVKEVVPVESNPKELYDEKEIKESIETSVENSEQEKNKTDESLELTKTNNTQPIEDSFSEDTEVEISPKIEATDTELAIVAEQENTDNLFTADAEEENLVLDDSEVKSQIVDDNSEETIEKPIIENKVETAAPPKPVEATPKTSEQIAQDEQNRIHDSLELAKINGQEIVPDSYIEKQKDDATETVSETTSLNTNPETTTEKVVATENYKGVEIQAVEHIEDTEEVETNNEGLPILVDKNDYSIETTIPEPEVEEPAFTPTNNVSEADLTVTETANSEGYYYKVQICALRPKNEVETTYFNKKHNLTDEVGKEDHEGWKKYTIQKYTTYKDARDARNILIESHNVEGAFVTAYNNGERIHVREALDALNQKWYK